MSSDQAILKRAQNYVAERMTLGEWNLTQCLTRLEPGAVAVSMLYALGDLRLDLTRRYALVEIENYRDESMLESLLWAQYGELLAEVRSAIRERGLT